MNYNLEVLNDKEFEDLCKDLLDIVYGVNFQLFKAGKDGGVDLLFSGIRGNEIVVQVKHYNSSSFAQLKRKLKGSELENIKKMCPEPAKYVLATSLKLSPKQTDEIKNILFPFVRSTDDIFGRRSLEAILSNNPHLEDKYFKLWLTSTNVLTRILNNGVINNSDFHRGKILNRINRYVISDDFNTAVTMLLENKFLIVTGLPGVGKTTLAYMLICERLAAGCELIFSDGKISEVEGLLSHDPQKKQIFFVDDFLGANLYDIRHPQNPESKVISFVEKIQSIANKYLVFTSRTTILNQATHRYEKLRMSRITEDGKYELELKNYSFLYKAKILYNHLYFSTTDRNFAKPFFKKPVYSKIIKHENFFPRLIEFITDSKHYNHNKFTSIEEFIFYQLDHPEEIWKHAFEEQLDIEDRLLVMTLFSLGGMSVGDGVLESAFLARCEYEVRHNNLVRKPNCYRNSLKKLLDGFIESSFIPQENLNRFSFLNPSIVDFLLEFLKQDKAEQKALLSSVAYIDQLTYYFGNGGQKIRIDARMRPKVFQSFIENIDDLGIVRPTSRSLAILEALVDYFPNEISSEFPVALSLLKDILANSKGVSSITLSLILLQIELYGYADLVNFIKHNFYAYVAIIISNADEVNDLEQLLELFKTYSFDFKDYIDLEENKLDIEIKLGRIFESLVKDIDFDDGDVAERVSELGLEAAISRVENNIWDEYCQFIDGINLEDYFDSFEHSYDISASDIVNDILANMYYDDDDDRTYRETLSSESNKTKDEWGEIDRLFS